MIRGIIFDCFGVLYHGSLNHLLDITPVEQRGALADLCRASDLGYVSRADYLKAVAAFTGRTESEVDHVISQDHVRNEQMFELVRSIDPKYTTALLSNAGTHVIDRLFTPAELTDLFDVVVLSSDLHMVKPAPAIFELTAQRMGLLPEECVMIDDLEINISGARQTGLNGIVYVSTGQTAGDLHALLAGE